LCETNPTSSGVGKWGVPPPAPPTVVVLPPPPPVLVVAAPLPPPPLGSTGSSSPQPPKTRRSERKDTERSRMTREVTTPRAARQPGAVASESREGRPRRHDTGHGSFLAGDRGIQ